MRFAVISVVVLAACHPPSLRDRARAFGHELAATGRGVAHFGAGLGRSIDPQVRVQVAQVATAAAVQAVATQPAAVDPPVAGDTSDADSAPPAASAEPASEPASEPAVMPTMTVHHVDAAPPTAFRLNYRNSSGSWTCSTYKTMNECQSSCTSMERQASLSRGTDPQCNCVEDVACP